MTILHFIQLDIVHDILLIKQKSGLQSKSQNCHISTYYKYINQSPISAVFPIYSVVSWGPKNRTIRGSPAEILLGFQIRVD